MIEVRSRRRVRAVWWLAGAGALVVISLGGAVKSTRLTGPGVLAFSGAAEVVTLPQYGEGGAHILEYAHGEEVTVAFPVRNTGRLPLVVKDVRFSDAPVSLLDVRRVTVNGHALPVRIGPGASARVSVIALEGNCRYFHEREIELFPAALVDVSVFGLDMTRRVAFDHEIVMHSPMIVGCPDRTLDRSDDVRPVR